MGIKKTKFTLGLLLLISIQAIAQESAWEVSFKLGRNYFMQEDYQLAVQSLKGATRQDPSNSYAPYAHFYSGVASYRLQNYYVARFHFNDILEYYPAFKQKNEVYFWLTLSALRTQEFEDYNKYEKRVKGDTLRILIDQAREEVYRKYVADSVLLKWYNQSPTDSVAAKVWLEKEAVKERDLQDYQTMRRLISRFGWDGHPYGIITESPKKESYKIALLMPFLLNDINKNAIDQGNQFILDFYKGLQVALKELDSAGIRLELFPYDTEASISKTEEILDLPELKSMDMIIGPVYPAPIQLVNQFSLENEINQVHPFTNNPDFIHPFSFLFKPSTVTEGKKAATLTRFLLPDSATCFTYFSTLKDSLASESYKETLYSMDSIYHVQVFGALKDKRNRILETFTSVYEEDKRYKPNPNDPEAPEKRYYIETKNNLLLEDRLLIRNDSVQLIFVPTRDAVLASSALSTIQARYDSILIIGRDSWMDFQVITYEQLGKLPVYFMAQDYIDYSRSEYAAFRDSYYIHFYRYPSNWSIFGYELLHFYGKMLASFGTYFQLGMQQLGFIKGKIYSGFDYTNAHDNQHIPVIKLEGFTIKEIQYE